MPRTVPTVKCSASRIIERREIDEVKNKIFASQGRNRKLPQKRTHGIVSTFISLAYLCKKRLPYGGRFFVQISIYSERSMFIVAKYGSVGLHNRILELIVPFYFRAIK